MVQTDLHRLATAKKHMAGSNMNYGCPTFMLQWPHFFEKKTFGRKQQHYFFLKGTTNVPF